MMCCMCSTVIYTFIFIIMIDAFIFQATLTQYDDACLFKILPSTSRKNNGEIVAKDLFVFTHIIH